MNYVVKKIEAGLCAKIFAFASALTCFVMIVALRLIFEPFIRTPDPNAVQGVAEGLLIGRLMSWSLLVCVPSFFFVGYLTGMIFAVVHNALASSKNLIRIKEGAFEFK